MLLYELVPGLLMSDLEDPRNTSRVSPYNTPDTKVFQHAYTIPTLIFSSLRCVSGQPVRVLAINWKLGRPAQC